MQPSGCVPARPFGSGQVAAGSSLAPVRSAYCRGGDSRDCQEGKGSSLLSRAATIGGACCTAPSRGGQSRAGQQLDWLPQSTPSSRTNTRGPASHAPQVAAFIPPQVHDVAQIHEQATGLAPPSRWDLVSDRQAMQEEQPLQVGGEQGRELVSLAGSLRRSDEMAAGSHALGLPLKEGGEAAAGQRGARLKAAYLPLCWLLPFQQTPASATSRTGGEADHQA